MVLQEMWLYYIPKRESEEDYQVSNYGHHTMVVLCAYLMRILKRVMRIRLFIGFNNKDDIDASFHRRRGLNQYSFIYFIAYLSSLIV